jgi:hypothetical protein
MPSLLVVVAGDYMFNEKINKNFVLIKNVYWVCAQIGVFYLLQYINEKIIKNTDKIRRFMYSNLGYGVKEGNKKLHLYFLMSKEVIQWQIIRIFK